jgi:hypothetical protein
MMFKDSGHGVYKGEPDKFYGDQNWYGYLLYKLAIDGSHKIGLLWPLGNLIIRERKIDR